jgi:acyl-coenzyme A thioesterase PaaI-like protein
MTMSVPEGFTPHFRQSPLTQPWEPLYSRTTDEAVLIGLRHCNSRGLVHGGLISALADNAMGLSAGLGLNAAGGLVTVSLALDFLGVAKPGQWLEFTTAFAKRGKTLCFAQLFVTADGETVARANATFRVIGA